MFSQAQYMVVGQFLTIRSLKKVCLYLSCTADQAKFRPHPTTLQKLYLKNTQVKYGAILRPVYHRVWATANRLVGTMSMAFSDQYER
jgi:hypothetical protein